MPRLVLSFLGSLEIKRDDDYLLGLTAKTQALIAYLAIEGQPPHRREVLAGLLWGEQGEAAARNNLRQSLHQLQHTLGAATVPWLLITPQTVQFNPVCDHALDVVEFTRLLADCAHHPHRCLETCRACHVRLQRAAALYRGPLLTGLSLKDSDAFEEWLQVKREHLAQRALALLSVLADYHARHGEYAQMEAAARRQIEVEPFSEEAHRHVMRACAWSGRRNLALMQYETCRRLLKDELGVEPVSETTALYDSLRAGNVAPAHPPAATQLPMPLTSFIGRGSEMSHVQGLLETTRLLTLIGTGGCGKTRLALQVAAELAEEFPDGAWFIELAPHADPALVSALVANVLGVREQAGRTHLELVTDYLRHKQLLLVLDNCEHLLDACARLAAAVLRTAPRVQLLATSRAPIGLAGELVFDVLPLPVPDLHAPLNLEALAQIESARLFIERAIAVNSQFELTDANAPAVADICRQLEGIPLALEIAAARTRALPVEELARRLDERFRLLTSGDRAASARQQTLQATMDWSYNLLAPPERLLLNRLAVFAGGWTLIAAEAVCSDERLPSAEILNGLAHLIDQSLVVLDTTPQSGAPRYRMLETIRQYAYEKLQSSGEALQWSQQHFYFFLHMAPAVEAKLQHDERGTWQKYLNAEHDNFRAALRWIAERGEIEPQLRLVVALIDFWRAQGYWREGRQYLEQALTTTGSRDAGLRSHWLARALFGAGYLAWLQSDYTAARPHLEASVRLWRELSNKGDLAYSLMNLAWVELQTGNYAVGQALAEESAALAREAGNNSVRGFALVYLGGLAFEQGDDVAGNRIFEEVLPVLREQGDKWNLAAALSWVGRRMYAQGNFQQAASLGEEALTMWREIGEQSGVAWMLHNLGYVVYAQEDFAQASAYFRESLALWQEAGCPFGILMVLVGFAVLAISASRLRHAARLFGATNALLTAIGAKLYPLDQATYERQLAALRARLDVGAFAAAWEAGSTLSLEQAIALVENR